MNRREAIKKTTALLGGVVFAPTIFGVLRGCTPSDETWRPELFNANQVDLTTNLADIIIPETDTLGAVAAGVPGFIEKMVNEVYTHDERETFLDGLDEFDETCRRETSQSFFQLSKEEQHEFALAQNKHAIESEFSEGPQFFLIFKELTLIGFFTSEPGAIEVLRYEPVPGIYQGCIPFEDVGRTWAT